MRLESLCVHVNYNISFSDLKQCTSCEHPQQKTPELIEFQLWLTQISFRETFDSFLPHDDALLSHLVRKHGSR